MQWLEPLLLVKSYGKYLVILTSDDVPALAIKKVRNPVPFLLLFRVSIIEKAIKEWTGTDFNYDTTPLICLYSRSNTLRKSSLRR